MSLFFFRPKYFQRTRECVAATLLFVIGSVMVLVLESSRCRAEAGSRYNGGHWRRIIRTASASGLSAQWSPVQGQGRNSQLFSAILPTSHYWCSLKRTLTFSDNIKAVSTTTLHIQCYYINVVKM